MTAIELTTMAVFLGIPIWILAYNVLRAIRRRRTIMRWGACWGMTRFPGEHILAYRDRIAARCNNVIMPQQWRVRVPSQREWRRERARRVKIETVRR